MAHVAKQMTIAADTIDVRCEPATTDDDGRVIERVVVTGETHQITPWRMWRITIEELEHADL